MEAGGNVYLPPDTPHRLESAGPEALRLLVVDCPAGNMLEGD
jgi:hypothetical protein